VKDQATEAAMNPFSVNGLDSPPTMFDALKKVRPRAIEERNVGGWR
jgi:hypothetical protein